MRAALTYRGPLSSCNYDCGYCPFAKNTSSRAELTADRRALERFSRWVQTSRKHRLSLLFTPWGEALIRRHYQAALARLSQLDHIERIAIQTNLSCTLDWLSDAAADTLAFWVTFHPGFSEMAPFLEKLETLRQGGFAHSVGMVGKREHLPLAQTLRQLLPPETYLWVNAYKSEGPGYYAKHELAAWGAIDPLFDLNNERHSSRGHACFAGENAFSVDGDGDVRRCHFVGETLGNLYRNRLETMSAARGCPNATCGCYIGYVHLKRLALRDVYGDGLLARIPRPISQGDLR